LPNRSHLQITQKQGITYICGIIINTNKNPQMIMKNLMLKVSEILKTFFTWLEKSYHYNKYCRKTNTLKLIKFKSVKNYQKYISLALDDMLITPIQFKKLNTSGLVSSFINKLTQNPSFNKRTTKSQSDIISALKIYSTYLNTIK
jgi:hypothetical protein